MFICGMGLSAIIAFASDPKPIPGQAGNDDIDLAASVIIDPAEIHSALGADLGTGYVVVRMKATPRTDKPLRIGPDDFTIISRKDGQRSQALTPEEIAGHGSTLVVKSAGQRGGGNRGGVSFGGIGMGNAPPPNVNTDAHIQQSDQKPDEKDSPLLAALKEKGLPDKEGTEPLEGLLYFPIDGKIKPKDVAIIYKGPAGKLVMEFQNPKRER
jgi:hypothetical protein